MNRIRLLREEFGWNQEDLARLLNVKRAAISKYETERIPLTGDTILKLTEIFRVTADYLLGKSSIRENINKEPPLYPEQQELLDEISNLSPEEIKKVLEYADLLKLKRKL